MLTVEKNGVRELINQAIQWGKMLENRINKMINILFVSVGRRVELLQAFHRAYKALELDGNIVATDIDPLASALQVADKPYIIPHLDSSHYIPTLVEICQREQINIVFPLIDPDIPILARNREAIEATGAHLAIVSQNAAGTTGDKWLTYQFLKHLSVPTPHSWLPSQLEPDQALLLNLDIAVLPRIPSE
jgi:carbamoyl-phosphate synthase large subunit